MFLFPVVAVVLPLPLQAVMQGLTNVSMMYLNYPAKVLFKSSRMVPIMCFGVVWQVRLISLTLSSVELL